MMKSRIIVSGVTDVGPKRDQNQDNYYVFGKIKDASVVHDEVEEERVCGSIEIIAVFDGMGGEHDGEKATLAAAQSMDVLKCELENNDAIEENSLNVALKRYYEFFKRRLQTNLHDYPTGNDVCGTTCAMIVLSQSSIVPIWIGDSRIYLFRNGNLYQITKDHTFAQERIDSGELKAEEAKKTPAWHMLTKYMGAEEMFFSIGEKIDVQDGDRFILCSDGLSDMYDNAQLIELLKEDARGAFQKIQLDINENGEDNCTFIIVDIIRDEEYSIENAINGVKKTSEKLIKTIKDKCLSINA